jgi:hypothetical protein
VNYELLKKFRTPLYFLVKFWYLSRNLNKIPKFYLEMLLFQTDSGFTNVDQIRQSVLFPTVHRHITFYVLDLHATQEVE